MKKLLRFWDNYLLKIGVSFILFFIAVYPKLPSIGISHTWVYIRLEDFLIAAVVFIWLIQLLRGKARIPISVGWPIFLYWFFGLLSLIFSLIFVGPHIANFFPKVAALSYMRRIEYMILFFVSFSTVRSIKDLRDYIVILSVTVFGFTLYGFGQRYYIYIWHAFPSFFEKNPFCFPSFQTGNEQFAKGIPLCLPSNARITSTFAGHYDLAAYLVLIIPILLGVFLSIKHYLSRIALLLLSIASATLLIFTASRISFVAYLIGACATFVFYRKKKFILPLILASIILLLIFNGSTARRFLETVRLTSVVTNSQGQVVGEAESSLPPDLRKKIAKNPLIIGNIITQNLPQGSGFIGLPQLGATVATKTAVVKSALSIEEAKRLKLENGGVEISTVSGNFLVRKALVYDISFTTRFQGEWPNAWKAFLRDPPLGSGFSAITLAADNDYLRALGESGILGLFSFAFIFIIFGITLGESISKIDSKLARGFLFGIAGGCIGLFVNATLIDVFEASKVAETLWLLLGIALGVIFIQNKDKIKYKENLKKIFSSHIFLNIYLFLILLITLIPSINNYFVADDFTWARWAASSTLLTLGKNFIDTLGFFYRPFDKIVMFFLYTIVALTPQGYHLFNLLLHFTVGVGVYILSFKIFKKKYLSFAAAFIFLFLPSQGENLFWISTISTTLSTFFIVYGLIFLIRARLRRSKIFYFLTIVFSILALLSYEMAVVFLPLVILTDFILLKEKFGKKIIYSYIPFVLIDVGYFLLRTMAKAQGATGSYAYNIMHFIPNVFGNFIGYWGTFILGENFLPLYTQARNTLRGESLLVGVFVAILALVLFGAVLIIRKNLYSLYKKNEEAKIFIYAVCFSFTALIPFLGLGNIALRYGYLASVGFAIALIVALELLGKKIVIFLKKPKIHAYYIILILVVLAGLFYYKQLQNENLEWQRAGKITNRTLSFFRLYYESIPHYSNIYFVNVPIRQANAWIFPVGLNDGLWFIYRDPTLKIYSLSTVREAKALRANAEKTSLVKNYIFVFDKNGIISEIK